MSAPKELLNVQIDGIWHQFQKGTRVIEACAQAGKFVPHYCYHPKLSSPGNCRMCLIEMGMPKLGPDRKPEIGRRWQTGNQLDPATADFLCSGYCGRHGNSNRFTDGSRMPAWGHGVSSDQSSARLPDLRPGRRVLPPGIQRRVWNRAVPAFSRKRSKNRNVSKSALESRSMMSAVFSAPAAFVS